MPSIKLLFLQSTNIYQKITHIFEVILMPLLALLIRFWLARIFWYAGLTKISNWKTTIFLFEYEYKVPFISPIIAAILATATELSCPILLILGFASRFATIPLLIMTAVIQFTYHNEMEHNYWAMLLAVILFYGPGKFSLDYLLLNNWWNSQK